ncbi:MAG: J domain-containing protein [Pseudoxanthomonas sp.]
MAEDTDFVALYDELGLDAACSMADFKQAYRRRVAQLHPDHPDNSSDISRLQRLNRLYAAAIEFQRTHGRLPGATRASPAGMRTEIPSAAHDAYAQDAPPVSGSPPYRRYVLLVALIGLALYGLSVQEPAATFSDTAEPTDVPRQDLHRPAVEKSLAIGMDGPQVRRIQGEPFNSHEQRWEYGPSWILFDCGKVVDWYSSPLHPLQVRSASPTGNAQVPAGKLRKC